MDLDKLKKAAKEKGAMALKKLIHSAEQIEDEIYNAEPEQTAEETLTKEQEEPENEPVSGQTQRFNLNDILSKLSSAPGDQTYSEAEVPEEDIPEPEEPKTNAPEPEENGAGESEADIAELISSAVADIRQELSKEIFSAYDQLNEKLNILEDHSKRLNDIYGRLGTLNSIVDKSAGENTKSSININGKLNAHDVRLTEISNSLGSVSKLNDSIFDLKNSQMNTKNTLSDLETSYAKLKRKMTAGVTIMSILCAIVVILEVMNLLS